MPICQEKPDFDGCIFGNFSIFTKKLRQFNQLQ